MLGHWKVLDLTDHRGEVAGFLLAELGADVVEVTFSADGPAPAGPVPPPVPAGPTPPAVPTSPAERLGAYTANKRRLHVDRPVAAARADLEALLAGVDVVLDTGPPGVLAAAGLGRDELDACNPRLVTVVITPFGVDGPRATQPASELTLAALGGPLRLQGTPERPPVQISVPQVWRHTGAEAAVAAMVAHARMAATGRSQFVDVSAQTAMTWTMLNAMEAFEVQGRDFERTGSVLKLATDLALCHPAADGYVVAVPRAQTAHGLLPWLREEGLIGPAWEQEDWSTFDHRMITGASTLVSGAELLDAVRALCARHPKSELLRRGLELGVTLAPVNALDDLLRFEHLRERDFWTSAEVDGRTVEVPGVAFRLGGRRPDAVRRYPAPGIDVPGSPVAPWGVRPAAAPAIDRPAPTRANGGPAAAALPFEGLKVADFSWIGVGPITSKCLADHGATVVRVESEHRIDGLRVQPPMKDGVFGVNRSHFYGAFNTSKLGLALDLRTEAGRALALRLACWADVVIDSFTPGVMERLGLGPAAVRALNPSVITVNTSLLGPGGRHSAMAGYGYHAAALAGFFGVVGWPDLPPDGPWLAYTDTIGPRLIIPVVLAALEHRRRTGEGRDIEVAQLEMALQFQAPEIIRCQLDGTVPVRYGNRAPEVAPQGVYPCRGEERWCAVTVPDDAAWQRLADLLGRPAWITADLDDLAGRQAAHDRIDEQLARWTATSTAAEVEALLCSVGIPAGVVAASSDLFADPQLRHRRFFHRLDHAEVGRVPYAGHQYRIAGYDHGPRWASPCLGQHTIEVLTDLLGVTPDELAEAAVAGALE